MGGNVRVVRGTGRDQGSGINWEIGGGGGISTVDTSIPWAIASPTTDSPASVNGDIVWTGVFSIGCTTTTLNASWFKGSSAGASENRIDTSYVMVVSPVVVVVSSASLSPSSPSVARQIDYGLCILTLLMLIVSTFMSYSTGSNFATRKCLRLPNIVAFFPNSTSRTVSTRILVFLFAL